MPGIGHRTMIQANVNHCRSAQDMLSQAMAEWLTDVAVVAEPYFVAGHWLGDRDDTVALVRRHGSDTPPLTLVERGPGYVAASWGDIVIVGVYISPSHPLQEFENRLAALAAVVDRAAPRQILVAGDFNAKSVAWGNPATACDRRGPILEAWLVASGLSLLNRGTIQTCVRQQGGSVVDLTFATPALAARVNDWRVEWAETLSDHRYIRWEVAAHGSAGAPSSGRGPFPRWALSRLDRTVAREAAFCQDWFGPPSAGPGTNVDAAAQHLRDALTEVCDASMPRSRRPPPRRAVYWWTEEVADIRAACVAARRAYTRSRRRSHRDPENEARLYAAYQEAKRDLKSAIGAAKDQARAEMLEGLNQDPWGRPYKAVRNQLRPIGPPITETLEPGLLTEVVRGLFPPKLASFTPPPMNPSWLTDPPQSDAPLITAAEFGTAAICLRGKKTAPGPDGVPAKIVALAAVDMESRFRDLFDRCFAVGRFPKPWKVGQLCLLRKEGRPPDSPSAYRPIVLLDEVGKLFERIIAARINDHLRESGPDLSDAQYGFRAGRSTIDALSRLKTMVQESWDKGEGVLAISFDIANAFNTIPHATIIEALRHHRVPPYIRSLLANYFEERQIVFVDRSGQLRRHTVESGVPQGSVLGPLLWNIGFDWLLRGSLLPGMGIICYADDTLITARGRNFASAACLASVGGSYVARRIGMLGLKVALSKTEAVYFRGPRQRRPPPDAHVTIQGVRVEVKAQIKYLGLIVDARWQFGPHFRGLSSRLLKAAEAFNWLLPNLGGPRARCRHLYAGIFKSMALYGAPIWADSLHCGDNLAQLRRPQRAVAQRVARCYRTVGFAAACALAGTPPWEHEARVLARVYAWKATQKALGERPTVSEVGAVREETREDMLSFWERDLAGAAAGRRLLDVLGPLLQEWLERPHGFMSYRLAQVLSGHGCFRRYLHRIGREEAPSCLDCGAAEDTAEHTLLVCPSWASQRSDLTAVVGPNLTLQEMVGAMLRSERAWAATASFCETVMSAKEAAEREREDNPLAPMLRRRRGGRTRRQYSRVAPPNGDLRVVGVGAPPPVLPRSPQPPTGVVVRPAIPVSPP